MNTIKTDENQKLQLIRNLLWGKGSLYFFLGLLAISVFSYFLVQNHWSLIITNHLGGLGIIGLLAILTKYLAKRKGYNYRKAFAISFFLPIIVGLIAVIIISLVVNYLYCGGGFSLLISLLITLGYLIIKRRNIHINSGENE